MEEINREEIKNLKILWVHTDFNGPENGLALFNNNKIWFSRKNNESDMYILLKISDEKIKELEEDHLNYCNQTGLPFLHGDPYKIIRKTHGIKFSNEKESKLRALFDSKTINRVNNDIVGEYIMDVKNTDFENYYVAHCIEYN